MRARGFVIAAVAGVLLLSGCAPGTPDRSPTPTSTHVSTPRPTPSGSPARITAVDPAKYATQFTFNGPGIDFDSADGNMHCGIWSEHREYADEAAEPTIVPYAGCRPIFADYTTDPSTDPTGNVECSGGELNGSAPPGPVCGSGQEFVGEAPIDGPVEVLKVNTSVTFAGFTCSSPAEDTIRCVREGDGAGFEVGITAYSYF